MVYVKHKYGSRKKEIVSLLRRRLDCQAKIRYYECKIEEKQSQIKELESEVEYLESL